MIPYGRQDINEADIDAVVDVLNSDFLTQGPAVPRFEAAVAAYCGVEHAVAVNSGTSALHTACLALGLGPKDWLWTSPNTFVASANCGLYCGAQVDFVDIDPRSYNLSVEVLAAKLDQAEGEGRLPKVVVPVHFAGQACDMRAVRELADQYRFRVIEDASHAIGGRYLGEPIGNCRWSDITVFSFHPVKIVTTGEGGMAVTNDPDLAATMARLRTHGITREADLMRGASDGPWYYQQIALGFNYRMTDIQAALGASQMRRLEDFVTRRRELAARYDAALADLPVIRPWQHPDTESAWHLYVIQVDSQCTSVSRKVLFERLHESGVGVNVHYIPVHTQPHYRQFGFAPGHCPVAERYYANALSLPMYSAMTNEQQRAVLGAMRCVLA